MDCKMKFILSTINIKIFIASRMTLR